MMNHKGAEMKRSLVRRILVVLCVCAVVMANGCAIKHNASNELSPVEIAKQHAMSQCGWKKSKVEYVQSLDNGNLMILVSRVPARPGSHMTVEITRDGRIVESHPGS